MTSLFSNRKVFAVVALLFFAAAAARAWNGTEMTRPTSLTLAEEMALFKASGIPDVSNAHAAPIVALGPTIPPGPWDEQPWPVALGPTIPPGPWDEQPWPVA